MVVSVGNPPYRIKSSSSGAMFLSKGIYQCTHVPFLKLSWQIALLFVVICKLFSWGTS